MRTVVQLPDRSYCAELYLSQQRHKPNTTKKPINTYQTRRQEKKSRVLQTAAVLVIVQVSMQNAGPCSMCRRGIYSVIPQPKGTPIFGLRTRTSTTKPTKESESVLPGPQADAFVAMLLSCALWTNMPPQSLGCHACWTHLD